MRVAAVLLVLALGACGGPARYSGPEGAPKVYVVGDSLVVEAWDDLRSALSSDRLASHKERGEDTSWAAGRLDRQVDGDRPDVAIVATGTNDWPDGWEEDDAEAVESVLSSLADVPCAIWVLPADRFASVGDRIAEAVAAHPDVHVADWAAVAADHPEWYRPDGVHHTGEGSRAYAAFIADARRTMCPS